MDELHRGSLGIIMQAKNILVGSTVIANNSWFSHRTLVEQMTIVCAKGMLQTPLPDMYVEQQSPR